MKLFLFATGIILLTSFVYFVPAEKDVNLESESFTATISITKNKKTSREMTYQNVDSTYIKGTILDLAISINPFKPRAAFKSIVKDDSYYKLMAYAKGIDGINYEDFFQEIVKHFEIKSDTTKQIAYLLEIDKNKIAKDSDNCFMMSLFRLVELLRDRFNAPIIVQDKQEDIVLYLSYDTLQFNTFFKFSDYLEKNQGITFKTDGKHGTIDYVTLSL